MFQQFIKRSFHLTAQALANRMGVRVTFGGQMAYATPDHTINLPNLPADSVIARALGLWYVIHEVSHLNETDFDWCKKCSPVRFRMLNIVEDHRIESAAMKRWPGARSIIVEGREKWLDEGKLGMPVLGSGPALHLLNGTLALLNARLFGADSDALRNLAPGTVFALKIQFPELDLKAYLNLLSEADDLQTTEEASNLVNRIIELVTGQTEDQSQEGGQQGGNDSGDEAGGDEAGGDEAGGDEAGGDEAGGDEAGGDEAGGDEAGGDEAGGDEAGGDEAGGDEAGGDEAGGDEAGGDEAGGDEAGGDEAGGDEAWSTRPTEQMLDQEADGMEETFDMGDALKESIQEVSQKEEQEKGRYTDGLCPFTFCGEMPVQGSGDRLVQQAGIASAALRTRLASQLQSVNRERRWASRKGSKLSSRHLSRVVTGDHRVFGKRQESGTPNTAVQILVDRSGSMAGDPIETAMTAALAIQLATDSLRGINTQVSAFPASSSGGLVPITSFGENGRMKADNFGVGSTGATPMSNAILGVLPSMFARSESRKVMLVITDGAPNDSESAMEAIRMARDVNVEMYAIGIETDPSHLFGVENTTVIQSVGELAENIFGLLTPVLTRTVA
ncbi:von Willebrand factor type A (plasmid) [Thioalkalivibrio sp. K90mix]|uniref:cobaltochelatase CobT-related protein n=1 Tax=Thioalkalivibrio sp. (strain K90mix) TaxID=396595 RepID=UPI000195A94B|nr:VWA domain-containing protein [Thioalkalivibrio sp. K90mix]ADC73359.1 von Willebrand factor type A [Thioalkalivibrio sp. K90mix]